MYGYGFLNSFKSVGGTSVSYIVDDYSPAASYSLRKVSSTATNCIRVRRSSDNTEQDIGFVGNDLDTASLLSFVGLNDGFVAKIYNQGGVGNPLNVPYLDAIMSSSSIQPKIVNSGTLITQNGKASMLFDGAGDRINFGLYDGTLKSNWDIYTTARINTGQQFVLYVSNDNTLPSGAAYSVGVNADSNTLIYFPSSNFPTATFVNGSAVTISNRNDVYDNLATDNLLIYTEFQHPELGWGFNGYENPTWDFIGYWSESIFWENSATTAIRTDIESNINTYYGIY